MLGIAILIGIVVGFYNMAKKRELQPVLWAVLSLVAWFGSQFIAGMILGLTNPYALNDTGSLLIWGLGGSVLGVVILYFIMESVHKSRLNKKREVNDELMDDDSSFEL